MDILKRYYLVFFSFFLLGATEQVYSDIAPSWVNSIRSGDSVLRIQIGNKILFRANYKSDEDLDREKVCSLAIQKAENYIKKSYPHSKIIPTVVELSYFDVQIRDCTVTLSVSAYFKDMPPKKKKIISKTDMDRLYNPDFWDNATIDEIKRIVVEPSILNKFRTPNDFATPFMLACIRNENPQLIKVLLDFGGDVFIKNNKGETALTLASMHNQNLEVFKLLLSKNTNVNQMTSEGMSLLMLACCYNENTQISKYLIEMGADINLKNYDGHTAFELADIMGRTCSR